MKKLSIIISVFIAVNITAQISNKDTFLIKEEYKKTCLNNYKLTASAGKYYYNGVEVSKQQYEKLDRFAEQICDSLLDKATGRYCKFYNKDSVIVEEGMWYREFYIGKYKSYYDDGKIKSIGCYTEDPKSDKAGDKIGKWLYYNKKGKLIKTENHK